MEDNIKYKIKPMPNCASVKEYEEKWRGIACELQVALIENEILREEIRHLNYTISVLNDEPTNSL